jgi:hypothetical protein
MVTSFPVYAIAIVQLWSALVGCSRTGGTNREATAGDAVGSDGAMRSTKGALEVHVSATSGDVVLACLLSRDGVEQVRLLPGEDAMDSEVAVLLPASAVPVIRLALLDCLGRPFPYSHRCSMEQVLELSGSSCGTARVGLCCSAPKDGAGSCLMETKARRAFTPCRDLYTAVAAFQ